jgi:2-isopropylmalate synthase
VVQALTDSSGKEVSAQQIWDLFHEQYLSHEGREYAYRGHHLVTATDGTDGELLTLNLMRHGKPMQLTGRGNGPIDALVHALALPFDLLSYEEKSIGKGSEARAAAFVEITTPSRVTIFGVGVHQNIITASILAVLSAVRRADARGLLPASGRAANG